MCPDIATLSAFYDGELEGSAAGDVESHVAECTTCALVVARYRRMSSDLNAVVSVDTRELARRSREHIVTRAALAPMQGPWWQMVRVPTPLVAVAALLIVMLSAGFAYTLRRVGGPVRAASGTGSELLDDIVKFLESREPAAPVTFRLPAYEIQVKGDPILIREADYRRALQ